MTLHHVKCRLEEVQKKDMQEQQADNLTKSLIKEECIGDIGNGEQPPLEPTETYALACTVVPYAPQVP